jgi:predicted choloylglycine hydrolase
MNQKWPDYEVTSITIEGWKARIFANEEISLGKITLKKTILVEKERLNEKKSPKMKIVVNDTFDLYFTIENVTLTLNPNNAYAYDLEQLGYTEKQTESNLEP